MPGNSYLTKMVVTPCKNYSDRMLVYCHTISMLCECYPSSWHDLTVTVTMVTTLLVAVTIGSGSAQTE